MLPLLLTEICTVLYIILSLSFVITYFFIFFFFFFFNDTATTEIYTLSLHDALPICCRSPSAGRTSRSRSCSARSGEGRGCRGGTRSEEHTSELQSQSNLVCRLLLEKKKKKKKKTNKKKNNNKKEVTSINKSYRHATTTTH